MLRKIVIIDFDSEQVVITENNALVKVEPSVIIRKKSETPLPVYHGKEALIHRFDIDETEVLSAPFANGKIIDIIGAKAFFKSVLKDLYGSNRFIDIYVIVSGNLNDEEKSIIERTFISIGYSKVNLISRPKIINKLLEYNDLPIGVYSDADITELVLQTNPSQSYTINVSRSALAEELRAKFLTDSKIKISIDMSVSIAKKYCSLFPSDMTKVIASGNDTITSIKKSVFLNARDLYPIVEKIYSKTTDLIAAVIMDSNANLSNKIVDSGILFIGSGIKISGYEEFIYEKLHLKSIMCHDNSILLSLAYNLILDDAEYLFD